MQNNLRVAVLGARKNIGWHHARQFRNAGADVVAVLGRRENTSSDAASNLKRNFGIDAKPYVNLEMLIKEQHPDIVSIATSNDSHCQYAIMALNAGCHVFLEKPILWDDNLDPITHIENAKRLFHLADERGRVVAVNTQMVPHFDKYMEAIKTENSKMQFGNFEVKILTSYLSSRYVNPAVDLLPHALSFLTRLDYNGQIDLDSLEIRKDYTTYTFRFAYNYQENRINVIVHVGHSHPDASIVFGFDNLKVNRVLQKSEDPNCVNYVLAGIRNKLRIEAEDPLGVLVRNFYEAVRNNDKTRLLVSPQEALANFRMQCEILQRDRVRQYRM